MEVISDLDLVEVVTFDYTLQYTLANPNRGVPIGRLSVPISKFVC